MQPELGRGHVQRVRVAQVAGRETAVLDVRIPGETVHIICAGGMGIGVIDAERRRRLRSAMSASTASPTQARWRSCLEGAQIVRVGMDAIDLEREGAAWRAQPGGAEALLLVPGTMATRDAADRTALDERGAAIADAITQIDVASEQQALRRALTKAIARVERRAAAIEGDLARMEGAEALAHRAQLFVAVAGMAPRGARKLTATDWTTGAAREVELPLDPARGAAEQIDALFRRARRLKEGATIARSRLNDASAALAKLEQLLASLAHPEADLDALEAAARAAAPHDFQLAQRRLSPGSPAPAPVRRPPYRTFHGASGARILAGRGAVQNDALTLHVARPHDLWLHAKGARGAHIVVPLARGVACPSDLLVEAAHLAAHFSDARDEGVVEVQYTERRYLRKPRGSAPGFVALDREKVIVLRKDAEQLGRLLASEVTPWR
jgi:predicted ribosome quality control (RQC) complex YloA/Tae2 family protein